MKKQKIKLTVSSLLIGLVLITAGCSASEKSTDAVSPGAPPISKEFGEGEDYLPESPEELDGKSPVTDDRLITYNFQFRFESEEFDKTKEAMIELNRSKNGYVQHSNVSKNAQYSGQISRNAYMIFRVPSDKAEEMVLELKKIGHLLTESSGSKDVTYEYQDIQSRIDAFSAQEKRLQELYAKADKIEDIIPLETRISEVIQNKEALMSRMKSLNDDISFSLIEVELVEVVKITPQETVKTTFGEKIKNAFIQSFDQFTLALEKVFIGIIFILPWMAVSGIAVSIYIYYRNKKK